MTFSNSQDKSAAAESSDYRVDTSSSIHIEETPCMVIRAVDVSDIVASVRWQPRTMQAWLT